MPHRNDCVAAASAALAVVNFEYVVHNGVRVVYEGQFVIKYL